MRHYLTSSGTASKDGARNSRLKEPGPCRTSSQVPRAARSPLATARRRWPLKQVTATSQQVSLDSYLAGDIPPARILSHLAGEAIRLDAYAATGLIDPGEPVPGPILNAARALQAAGYSARALPQSGLGAARLK